MSNANDPVVRPESTSGFGLLSDQIKQNFLPSIVVFLVALPLCMGIAIAAGMPVSTGLATGIIGGLVVGSLGGAPLQVSGPAAGLVVVIYEIVQTDGVEMVGVVVLLAGVIQLAAGMLRLGGWFRAVSPAVVQGMLAGIGVLIFASQFHVMVDDVPKGAGWENLLSIPEAVAKAIVPSSLTNHDWAVRVGLLAIVLIVTMEVFIPKRWRVAPGPLVAVLGATLMAAALSLDIKYVELDDSFFKNFHWLTPGRWTDVANLALLPKAVTVALVASAETLLCAVAVDKLHGRPEHRTQFDRELAAQGLGNALCGMAGCLPMTGVIVRSAANVGAGATGRASAIMHGVWLLLFVTLFPAVLRWVPTSALAAILVYLGYKLMDWPGAMAMWRRNRGDGVVLLMTVVGVVAFDLLSGIAIGFVVSAIKLLHSFTRLKVRLTPAAGEQPHELHLRGAATFLRLPKLAAALESLPTDAHVIVHMEALIYVDHACAELLREWRKQLETSGGHPEADWTMLDMQVDHVNSELKSDRKPSRYRFRRRRKAVESSSAD